MTTQPKTQGCSKKYAMKQPDDRSRRSLSQGELDVGSGSSVRPSDGRLSICRFTIRNYSKGGHHDRSQWYKTSQRAAR